MLLLRSICRQVCRRIAKVVCFAHLAEFASEATACPPGDDYAESEENLLSTHPMSHKD